MRLPDDVHDPTPDHQCPGPTCHGMFLYWQEVGMICSDKLEDVLRPLGGILDDRAAEITTRIRIARMDGLGLA